MNVKHVSEIIGDFGKWQLNIAAFYFTIYILSPFNNFGITFHAPKVKYWCEGHDNYTSFSNNINNSLRDCQTCHKWKYEDFYKSTIISEYDLVCDKSWLPSLSQSCYQLGYVVNGLILGYLSDRFGRRPVLWLAITIEVCGGLSLIFSQSMVQYIISRFFLGLGDSGRGVCLYLLVLETVGTKYRSDIAMSVSFGWIIGYISLPGFAYLLRHFRYLQAISTFSAVIMMILWLWTIPESPRWLLTNNRIDSARISIMKAAKMNGKLINDIIEKLAQLKRNAEMAQYNNHKKNLTIIDLLRQKQIRKYTLIFWFSFAVNAFIYHGISLNIGQIGGNLFVNFAIAGVVEIPSILLNLFGLRHLGRKKFTVWTMLLASISYLLIVVVTAYKSHITDYIIIKMVLAMVGKLFIFSSFNAIYIHAGEIFPTILRHTGIGSCSIAARIGSVLAPFVKEMSEYFNFGVSMLVFGFLSLMATFMTLFLPETKNKEIPDNIREVEELEMENLKIESQNIS